MRRYIVFFLGMCAFVLVNAQNLTVKSVNLRPQDARARTNPRNDSDGKKCAIIRVGVVGIENLEFPDAVGNVERKQSEYVVYVPEGLKKLQYNNNSGQKLGMVIFDDWGLEIQSLASYDVIFETDNHFRSAVFSVSPKNARLMFDGKKITINAEGMAVVNKPIGEYTYHVVADGYENLSGKVVLKEDEISTVTDVVLQEILYPVIIKAYPNEATVFIDNVLYTKDNLEELRLPAGEHSVRVTATNYEDEERIINVRSNTVPEYFTLKENKVEVVKHKEERTRTSINVRNAFYLTGVASVGGGKIIGNYLSKDNAYLFSGELSGVQHCAGILAIREAIGIGAFIPNDNEKYFFIPNDEKPEDRDSTNSTFFDAALQLGISIPFAKNRHLLSIFGGAYGRMFTYEVARDTPLEEMKSKELSELKDISYDYGLRVSARIDFGHFSIGADVNESLNKMGLSAGINLGLKLYRLKKKKK